MSFVRGNFVENERVVDFFRRGFCFVGVNVVWKRECCSKESILGGNDVRPRECRLHAEI